MIIYQYTTTANDKCYIGQHITDNLNRYFMSDLSRAAKGDTRKPALHNAMRAYPGTWSAKIIFQIPNGPDKLACKERLNKLEQFFIRWFESNTKSRGYNIAAGGSGSFGYTKVITPEHRAKLAKAGLGRKHTPETKAKMSAWGKGRPKSAEHRAKVSAGKTGIKLGPFTLEHCEKIRQANIGKKLPIEVVEKMRASMLALRKEVPQVFRKRRGTSKYKGVSLKRGKWLARVRYHAKDINLGRYELETEAAKAYDIAARKYLGNFALLNFPKDGELRALREDCSIGVTSTGREPIQSIGSH